MCRFNDCTPNKTRLWKICNISSWLFVGHWIVSEQKWKWWGKVEKFVQTTHFTFFWQASSSWNKRQTLCVKKVIGIFEQEVINKLIRCYGRNFCFYFILKLLMYSEFEIQPILILYSSQLVCIPCCATIVYAIIGDIVYLYKSRKFQHTFLTHRVCLSFWPEDTYQEETKCIVCSSFSTLSHYVYNSISK